MTEQTQHTSGPWYCNQYGVITGGKDNCTSIAETPIVNWENILNGKTKGDHAQAKRMVGQCARNGKLMEAAPDMLEALGILEFALTDDALNNGGMIDIAGALGTIRHAMAKARGE